MLSGDLISFLSKSSIFLLLLLSLTFELIFDELVVSVCPFPETLEKLVLHPKSKEFAKNSLASLVVGHLVLPSIESSSIILVHPSDHVVSHDLLRKTLRLSISMDSARLHCLNLYPLVVNLKILIIYFLVKTFLDYFQ